MRLDRRHDIDWISRSCPCASCASLSRRLVHTYALFISHPSPHNLLQPTRFENEPLIGNIVAFVPFCDSVIAADSNEYLRSFVRLIIAMLLRNFSEYRATILASMRGKSGGLDADDQDSDTAYSRLSLELDSERMKKDPVHMWEKIVVEPLEELEATWEHRDEVRSLSLFLFFSHSVVILLLTAKHRVFHLSPVARHRY